MHRIIISIRNTYKSTQMFRLLPVKRWGFHGLKPKQVKYNAWPFFVTRNPWKVQLFTPSFKHNGFHVLTFRGISVDKNPPAEVGLTAVENALIKARHYHARGYPWVFGDDAGLEIDALGGEPGLEARRWNGYFSDDADGQTWLEYLLFRLRDILLEARTSSFVSGWALVAPDGVAYTREIR